ncbi:T9SS type A sorting domain-containing protein [Pontibacter ruber]|uniref:T9SS type A sorting domain-containing protein n=1 Tax=Pontibacter ruber TaxID=1343895 RepID=A0ABW5CVJ7_9BACT|nr:T9SS type A sorting domain-containing protein [Pontibacter ruber]
MNMNQLKHLVLLVCLLAVIAPALAGGKGQRNPELRKELKTYMRENVLPVLRKQRMKLETQISAQDKAELEKLRTSLQQIKAETKELQKSLKAEREASGTPLTVEQKAALKAQHEKARQVYAAAGTIASRYKPQLDRMNAAIASDRTRWDADIKAIVAKYETAPEGNQPEKRGKRFEQQLKHRQLMRPARFILWDVSKKNKGEKAKDATAVYPNPSSSTQTINYTVAKEGNVTITLVDGRGTILRTLLSEQQTRGKHTLEVNLSGLPDATYYYKIETAAGTVTKRIIKR